MQLQEKKKKSPITIFYSSYENKKPAWRIDTIRQAGCENPGLMLVRKEGQVAGRQAEAKHAQATATKAKFRRLMTLFLMSGDEVTSDLPGHLSLVTCPARERMSPGGHTHVPLLAHAARADGAAGASTWRSDGAAGVPFEFSNPARLHEARIRRVLRHAR